MRASGDMIRTSAASASAIPPPAAAPLTAAITGWGSSRIAGASAATRSWWSNRSTLSPTSPNALRSSPEQKPRPAPVSTTTRTDLSAPASSSAACSSSIIGQVSAFSDSGRLSVIWATPSLGSVRSTRLMWR